MADEEIVEHRRKRARVGRLASEILEVVEKDTPHKSERTEKRDIFDTLLYLGRPKRDEPLVDSLRVQTIQFGNAYRFSKDVALECVFEW